MKLQQSIEMWEKVTLNVAWLQYSHVYRRWSKKRKYPGERQLSSLATREQPDCFEMIESNSNKHLLQPRNNKSMSANTQHVPPYPRTPVPPAAQNRKPRLQLAIWNWTTLERRRPVWGASTSSTTCRWTHESMDPSSPAWMVPVMLRPFLKCV